MVFRQLWSVGALIVGFLLFSGCGGGLPVAGESCTTSTEGACDDTTAALFCLNGKWTRTPCRGSGGCKLTGNQLTCDQAMGVSGEVCITTGPGTGACSTDGKAQLTCQSNQFQKVSDCVTCNVTSTNQIDCRQPCGPQTCAGCCFNGACQPGNTASACGKSGVVCSACGTNQVCKTDQTCGVDPNSQWRVQPLSAVITSTNNGASWDGDGSAPDPFIAMICPPGSAPKQTSTPAVQDTLQPSWTTGGCVTTAGALLAEPWVFQPYDEDFSAHDPISQAWSYQFREADFIEGTVNLNAGGGLTSITVQLQKQ
jgi:hypothetical protein